MVNNLILQGRLTRDVESGTTNSGITYANFTVAWSEKYGETEQKLFMNCKAWRTTAELIAKHFKKGDELIVEGRVLTETYEKDGETKSATRLSVDRLHFTYGKKETTNTVCELEPVDESDLPF